MRIRLNLEWDCIKTKGSYLIMTITNPMPLSHTLSSFSRDTRRSSGDMFKASDFLWSRWRGKHFRRMRNPQFTYLVRGPYTKHSCVNVRAWIWVYGAIKFYLLITYIVKVQWFQWQKMCSTQHISTDITDAWWIMNKEMRSCCLSPVLQCLVSQRLLAQHDRYFDWI